MKKILIYGDSNVWGDNFYTNKRIADDKQWVNILQKKLGKNYKIYQAGLPGRLAGDDEIIKTYKNGKNTFISTFKTCAPIDKLIIMLGTNDLQTKYNKTKEKIISDLLWYKETIDEEFSDDDNKIKYFDNKKTDIIYILPPNFNDKEIFNEQSEIKRQQIIDYFKNSDLKFVQLNNMSLFEDGIHLDYESHKKLATIIEGEIKNYE